MTTASLTNVNEGVSEEPMPPDENRKPEQAKVSRLHKFSDILRRTGATVLIAAALSFMIQGWHSWNSLERYFTFLGFTGVLAGLGLFCGLTLKDSKGARTFLALATAFIPAHFAQLGAFIYSFFGTAAKIMPESLIFVADSPTSVMLSTIGTAALALPLAFLGFSTLARGKAGYLTFAYLAANALLLIPVRDPETVFLISSLMFIGLTVFDVITLAAMPGLKTLEGRFSRLLPFVPFAIMLARCALYGPSLYLLAVILGALATLMYIYAPYMYKSHSAAQNMRFLSLAPAYCSWKAVMEAFFHAGFGDFSSAMVVHLPFALFVGVLSLNAEEDGPLFRRIAGVIAVSACLYQLFLFGGFVTAVLTVLVSLIVFCAAFAVEEKGLFYAGGFGFASGLLYHLRYAGRLYHLSPWLSLAAIGIVAVVTSSYVERNYQRIFTRMANFKDSFKSWR